MEKRVELENAFLKISNEKEAVRLLDGCKEGDLMISIHDTQGMYIRVSESASTLTGYSSEELQGNSAYDYFHPDDFQAILKSHAKITIKPEVDDVKYRLKKADGELVSVQSLSRTITDNLGKEIIVAFTAKRI